MHRALDIPEVAAMICSQASSPSPSETHPSFSNPDLAVLARTSSVFKEHALNALWSTQHGFANILRCMPDDIWGGTDEDGDVNHLDIVRPIVQQDLDRFMFYNHRVRILYCTSSTIPCVAVFAALGRFSPADTDQFFPRLTQLFCDYFSSSRLTQIHRFLLTPHITRIEIDLTNNRTTTEHFPLIESLPAKCPLLAKADTYSLLPISLRISPAEVRRVTSMFACGLKRIESLRVRDLDQPALDYLGTLSTLTQLYIVEPMDFKESLADAGPPFPSLTNLGFSTNDVAAASAFMRALTSSLVSIEMALVGAVTVQDLCALYGALASLPSPLALHSLCLRFPFQFGQTPFMGPSYVVGDVALKQLFCFANLTELSLESPQGFDLDDAVILEMATAWPRIVSLRLAPIRRTSPITPRLTLEGFRLLARHCPELMDLSIAVDASSVPVPQIYSQNRSIQHKLSSIILYYSPILAPPAVASFLSGIFSNLRALSYNSSGGPDLLSDHWQSVATLLPQFAAARSEEVAWAQMG
ncbi:hypothetical protein DFH06DRAFT_749976 [Mycena polygramma]|nr:hypothetical protein DFH06DRAFT_749976 [Mycena polygramma]